MIGGCDLPAGIRAYPAIAVATIARISTPSPSSSGPSASSTAKPSPRHGCPSGAASVAGSVPRSYTPRWPGSSAPRVDLQPTRPEPDAPGRHAWHHPLSPATARLECRTRRGAESGSYPPESCIRCIGDRTRTGPKDGSLIRTIPDRMLPRRTARAKVAALVAAWLVLIATASPFTATQAAERRTLDVTDTLRLHLVKKSGAILKERGTATGTLPGKVKARFDISNPYRVTGRITLYPRNGGSLTAAIVAYPQSIGTVVKFNGNMVARSGTGRFSDATGRGTFNGKMNRRTWNVVGTARAKLTF